VCQIYKLCPKFNSLTAGIFTCLLNSGKSTHSHINAFAQIWHILQKLLMAHFNPSVLRHSCKWNTPENESSKIGGFPDSIALDVNEGFELLYFVTRYMDSRGWESHITFQNIESVLKTRLPFNVRTHRAVKEWLDKNLRR
jgi:hypothetical protein